MSSNLPEVSIIILGGGPAGSAAAITAAGLGMNVVLFERDEFPRHAPGESLHPGVQPLLRQLGVEQEVLAAGFLRHAGNHVRWEGAERFQPFGEDANGLWLGFQAWRPTFDTILLDQARRLGVSIRQPCPVTGLLTNNGKVIGVETDTGPVQAGMVIDATGRWRAVSRWLNQTWRKHGPQRIAWYGYATGSLAAHLTLPSLRADAQGWTWVAPVKPQTFAWTRLNFNNARPAADWLPPELEGLTPTGPFCGADVTWQMAEHPAGPGFFLAGDAAATIDPAASHGVLKALMSGIYAGHLASHVLNGNVSGDVAAIHYSEWVREWFDRDMSRLDELYKLLPQYAEMSAAVPHWNS